MRLWTNEPRRKNTGPEDGTLGELVTAIVLAVVLLALVLIM